MSTGIEASEPNCVLVGLSPSNFHYERLNEAFRLLKETTDARLVAVHKGRYYKRGDGLALGPGPFVSALQFATDVEVNY